MTGLQFRSVPQVEIVHSGLNRRSNLRAVHVVCGAIHDGPEGPAVRGKFAGEDAVGHGGGVRLPIRGDQVCGKAALHLGDAANGLGVASA